MRRICQFVGACGLIVSINTFAQSAGGAAGGGAASGSVSAGPATSGTAPAASAPASAARATTVAPAGTGSSVTAAGAARPGAEPVVQSGQSLTVAPGQSLTSPSGPTVSAQQGTGIVPGQTPAAAQATQNPKQNTVGQPQQSAVNPGVAGASPATPTGGVLPANAVASQVNFGALPSNVQAALQAQAASGVQLGTLQQINTSQGTVFRAQAIQNGVASEVFLNAQGQPISSATVASMLAVPGAAPVGSITGNTATANDAFSNLPVAGVAPVTWAGLAAPIQSAFAAQSGGLPVENLTFTRGANGGVYSGMVNGQPVQVRVGPNGLPLASAAVPRETGDTNEMTLDDLPMAVRDRLRDEMPNARVTEIRRVESPDGDVFAVYTRGEDNIGEVHIGEDGRIVREATEWPVVITDTSVTEPAFPQLEWTSLPVAIKDAFEAHADAGDVKALALTNYNGKAAYAIDYSEDALRHRLFVDKDGKTIGVQTNLFRASTAVASSRRPILVEDLPLAARATVEDFATAATVTRIELGMRGDTPVYNVEYLHDGETRVMAVTPEGARLDEAVGAPPATTTGSEGNR